MVFDLILPPILGLVGLLLAFVIYQLMSRHDAGPDNVRRIADQIHLGAMVFMHREYKMLAMFASVLVLAVYFSPLGQDTAIAFIVGALSSATAGYLGMYAATRANVRTAVAANDHGSAAALNIAFYGGSIMGLCVASLGLIGLGGLFYFFGTDAESAHSIHGFGMGASVVALFSRVGGGIFTKSADVGADLVGKIEAGIPEDDPRNPGVIADNVGDNVGDIAGMGSDIFESYCGSMIACVAIASTSAIVAEQQVAMMSMSVQVSPSEVKELSTLFKQLDTDGSGTLTLDELIKGLDGFDNKEKLIEVLEGADTDGSGDINYSEFLAATMDDQIYMREDYLRTAFKMFDKDGSGKIDSQEVVALL